MKSITPLRTIAALACAACPCFGEVREAAAQHRHPARLIPTAKPPVSRPSLHSPAVPQVPAPPPPPPAAAVPGVTLSVDAGGVLLLPSGSLRNRLAHDAVGGARVAFSLSTGAFTLGANATLAHAPTTNLRVLGYTIDQESLLVIATLQAMLSKRFGPVGVHVGLGLGWLHLFTDRTLVNRRRESWDEGTIAVAGSLALTASLSPTFSAGLDASGVLAVFVTPLPALSLSGAFAAFARATF